MKKIFSLVFLTLLIAACGSTLPVSMNPDKGSFNSGTIGSVRSTDNIPVANAGTAGFNLKDTSYRLKDTLYKKSDTTHRNF